ncbi:MAG: hypothetical protein MK096_06520 [Oleiphilaceae bacterium]|nr:hypothetical protein [Oleiphilaceae bacterium]
MSEESAYALFKDSKLSVITFSTKDAAFAIPLQQVLYIEKDVKRNIQLDELNSFNHEVITYQNSTVELYDFNKLIGAEDHQARMLSLIDSLVEYESVYNQWFEQIENSIHDEEHVARPIMPKLASEFIKWAESYKNSNIELMEVINALAEPAKELHRAFDQLSHMNKQSDQASLLLKRINENSLKTFHNHIQQAKERAENSIRPIILFVEHDEGRISALRLDNIKDIVNYDWSNFSLDASAEGLMKERTEDYHIEGFLRNEDQAPLMLINCKTETMALPQTEVA